MCGFKMIKFILNKIMKKIKDVVLIYNFSKNFVSSVDKEDKILIRLLGKNHLKTLVTFMNSTFIPNIIE
jgi:hypothetical protein